MELVHEPAGVPARLRVAHGGWVRFRGLGRRRRERWSGEATAGHPPPGPRRRLGRVRLAARAEPGTGDLRCAHRRHQQPQCRSPRVPRQGARSVPRAEGFGAARRHHGLQRDHR
jgi:hypothetical protein